MRGRFLIEELGVVVVEDGWFGGVGSEKRGR